MVGKLIVLEGIDGSGKTTQARLLYNNLVAALGEDKVLLTQEPGGTALGLRIKDLIMAYGKNLDPLTQLWLFQADRSRHLQEVIRPALAQEKIIICDRFTLSSVVYQGRLINNIALEVVRVANLITCRNIDPITLLIHTPPMIAAQRLAFRENNNSLDSLDITRLQKISQAYLTEGHKLNNCESIDGDGTPEEIAEKVSEVVKCYL